MTESELVVGKLPFQGIDDSRIQKQSQATNEDDEEDRFLKELEKENKILEEELKNLQRSTSNKRPPEQLPLQTIPTKTIEPSQNLKRSQSNVA